MKSIKRRIIEAAGNVDLTPMQRANARTLAVLGNARHKPVKARPVLKKAGTLN